MIVKILLRSKKIDDRKEGREKGRERKSQEGGHTESATSF